MKIAIDAMGGDFAPANPVAGAIMALRELDAVDLELVLVGNKEAIVTEMAKHKIRSSLAQRICVHHASEVVEMTDGAAHAVRRKKDSSINRAVELIKNGEAEAVVSAGHTGALVAASMIKLRTLPGIERPGIATVMPTEKNLFLLIDAGANPDATPEHLVGYAVMGSIYSREVLGYEEPRVGLMSIGTEAGKGNEFTKSTYALLKEVKTINFVGNVEGHGLYTDPVEVVVCNGFIGNIVLKTSESLAKAIFTWLGHEIKSTPIRIAGAMLARGAFRAIKKRTNTDEYGGSPLLGVNGICIKAHGNSSPKAIRNAIRVAHEAVSHNVNEAITAEMSRYHEHHVQN